MPGARLVCKTALSWPVRSVSLPSVRLAGGLDSVQSKFFDFVFFVKFEDSFWIVIGHYA